MGKQTTTKSVCPECGKVIDAVLVEKGGSIHMQKSCPEHGKMTERLYDAEQYRQLLKYLDKISEFRPNEKLTENFHTCEICPYYKTSPALAIIDVTNRCNLRCEYCFANADATGSLYEPSYDSIMSMVKKLRTGYTPPVPAILFSGGEPTIRNDFIDIVRETKKTGFFVIAATNGYKIASSQEYTQQLRNAGMSILYLSFDGLTDKSNTQKHNHKIIEKILSNCRTCNLGIVLVPTTIKGINSGEVYELIKFAVKNSDIIKGINFQPISFCGRMAPEDRANQRYTIPDLINDIEKQSEGVITKEDFHPVPAVLPLTKFVESLSGHREVAFSVHPMCGSATYLFKDGEGNIIPITRFIDVERFMALLEDYADRISKSNAVTRPLLITALLKELLDTIDQSKAPKKFSIYEIIKEIILSLGDMKALNKFHNNSVFLGIMHFQDPYNADIDRLTRCAIHYMTPDEKMVSFCVYNSLGYRNKIEDKYKTPYGKDNK